MFDTGVVVSAVDQLTAGIDTLLDTDAAYDSLGRDELLDVVRSGGDPAPPLRRARSGAARPP